MEGTQELLIDGSLSNTAPGQHWKNRLLVEFSGLEFDPFNDALLRLQCEPSRSGAASWFRNGCPPAPGTFSKNNPTDSLEAAESELVHSEACPAKTTSVEPDPDDAGSMQAPSVEVDAKRDSATVPLEALRRLEELSKAAASGDQGAIADIQRILDSNDALWRHLGDVEKTTEAMLIEILAGSGVTKESVRRSVADLRSSLLGPTHTPLVRITVGRVVACWLFANFVDRWCGWAIKNGGRAGDLAKLLGASEKRYQIAVKSLKLAQEIA